MFLNFFNIILNALVYKSKLTKYKAVFVIAIYQTEIETSTLLKIQIYQSLQNWLHQSSTLPDCKEMAHPQATQYQMASTSARHFAMFNFTQPQYMNSRYVPLSPVMTQNIIVVSAYYDLLLLAQLRRKAALPIYILSMQTNIIKRQFVCLQGIVFGTTDPIYDVGNKIKE